MNNLTKSAQSWELNLNSLLNRCSLKDKYLCVAGIPGPFLDLRSGSLPESICYKNRSFDYIPIISEATGLDIVELRKIYRNISQEYSLINVIYKYKSITFDLQTRLILLKDYIKAFFHKLRGLSVNYNVNNKVREVQLCIHNKVIKIAYPADLVSISLLWEVFAVEAYYSKSPVKVIYDFGANIGFSSIYFHILNPSAKLVCVEPMEESYKLLKHNIQNNNISAELVNAAVGNVAGKKKLYFGDQSHALPSLHTKQSYTRQVSVIPFDKIVKGKGYGLKIDIEGAEGLLSGYPSIIENASWIDGELHYSGDIKQNLLIDSFFSMVEKKFFVKKSRPVIYFVGDEVLLCISFKTLKKK